MRRELQRTGAGGCAVACVNADRGDLDADREGDSFQLRKPPRVEGVLLWPRAGRPPDPGWKRKNFGRWPRVTPAAQPSEQEEDVGGDAAFSDGPHRQGARSRGRRLGARKAAPRKEVKRAGLRVRCRRVRPMRSDEGSRSGREWQAPGRAPDRRAGSCRRRCRRGAARGPTVSRSSSRGRRLAVRRRGARASIGPRLRPTPRISSASQPSAARWRWTRSQRSWADAEHRGGSRCVEDDRAEGEGGEDMEEAERDPDAAGDEHSGPRGADNKTTEFARGRARVQLVSSVAPGHSTGGMS